MIKEGKAPWDLTNSGFGTDEDLQTANLAFDLILGPKLGKGITKYSTKLGNNYLDLQSLRNFNHRYLYNLIKPKTSIIFNDSKLDKLFDHTVKVHNTFTRGVDPYEALKFRRFPEGSNVNDIAEYSLTHIPERTATNTGGLLDGENALYTSNSIGLSRRYTNGNGFIGAVRRPITYGLKTRRLFLHDNDFRFYPIPKNRLSATTDYPSDWAWSKRARRVIDPRTFLYGGKRYLPLYSLSPETEIPVRANAGSFSRILLDKTDKKFRHYLHVGDPGLQPVELLWMRPIKTSETIQDYDYTSVGFSHKK